MDGCMIWQLRVLGLARRRSLQSALHLLHRRTQREEAE